MPTIEEEVGLLSTAATALTTAVNISKSNTDAAIATFAETTNTVVNSLNLVDNTADTDKPVSTLQASAIAGRQATLVDGTNISTVNGMSLLGGSPLVIERAPTEIAAETYDNRADLKTIVGSLAGDSVVVEGIGLLQFVETEEEPEDDETCFTVPGVGQWLLAAPSVDLLAAFDIFEGNTRYEDHEDELLRFNQYLISQGVI
jgi:hypothetical protein